MVFLLDLRSISDSSLPEVNLKSLGIRPPLPFLILVEQVLDESLPSKNLWIDELKDDLLLALNSDF